MCKFASSPLWCNNCKHSIELLNSRLSYEVPFMCGFRQGTKRRKFLEDVVHTSQPVCFDMCLGRFKVRRMRIRQAQLLEVTPSNIFCTDWLHNRRGSTRCGRVTYRAKMTSTLVAIWFRLFHTPNPINSSSKCVHWMCFRSTKSIDLSIRLLSTATR